MICEGCGQAAISTTKAGRPICPDCIDEGYGDECYAPAIGEGSQMSDELNVWREASDAASGNAVKWKPAAADRAAAVIRDYGDKRYQQAIADVVEWINTGAGPYVEGYGEEIAQEITRRFGKDA